MQLSAPVVFAKWANCWNKTVNDKICRILSSSNLQISATLFTIIFSQLKLDPSPIAGRMRTIRKYLIIISLPLALGKHFKSFSTKALSNNLKNEKFYHFDKQAFWIFKLKIFFPREIKTKSEMVSADSGEWTKATIERNYWVMPCVPLCTFYVFYNYLSRIFFLSSSWLLSIDMIEYTG